MFKDIISREKTEIIVYLKLTNLKKDNENKGKEKTF